MFAIFCYFLCFVLQMSNSVTMLEFNALKDLYDATSGSFWNWNVGANARWNFTLDNEGIPLYDPCGSNVTQKWQGINCTQESNECVAMNDCHIIAISLVEYNLSGSLPQTLNNLTLLQSLVLTESSITGSIPSSLGDITTLTSLSLYENSVTGSIPSTFTNLQSLIRLNLGFNSLTGRISSSLLQIHSLEHLILTDSYFTGPLPTFIGWSNLITFNVADNLLSGPIPETISFLSNLVYLDLDQNSLSGSIPSLLSSLSALRVIDLDKNLFTGSLPPELAHLPVLNFLYTSQNFLSGSIPSEYGQIRELLWFVSYLNQHDGSIPSSLGNCHLLLELIFESNHLTGHLPSSLSGSYFLLRLELSTNSLSGSLPEEWNNLKLLNQIFIHNNQLTGTIPNSWGNLSSLNALDFGNNHLSGTLPDSLFQLHPATFSLPSFTLESHSNSKKRLQATLMSDKHLKGFKDYTVDDILNILHHEVYFRAESNNNISPSPSSTSSTSSSTSLVVNDEDNRTVNFLRDIILANNHFTGCLPSHLCTPSLLRMILISDNHFECDLPSLENCSNLESFLAQNNKLTGQPGHSFSSGDLMKVQAIDFSNNRFTGSVPYEFFSLPSINTIIFTSGCFNGPLSNQICNGKKLTTLILEGLHAGPECRLSVTNPFAVNDVYFSHPFGGTIPACLWEMSNLTVLHLTGNGHHGTLPSSINFPHMIELNLKLNGLRGDSAPFLCLLPSCDVDLSNNKISHTLDRNSNCQEILPGSGHLHIQNNRISGSLPPYLSRLASLSVLAGEATQFYCSFFSRHELPSQDPDRDSYICGSQLFDSALVLWAIGAVISLGYFTYFIFHFSSSSSTSSSSPYSGNSSMLFNNAHTNWWSSILIYLSIEKYSSNYILPSFAQQFMDTLRGICNSVRLIAVIVVPTYLLLILILKFLLTSVKTEQYQYTWVISIGGMSGQLAASLCLLIGTIINTLVLGFLPRSSCSSNDQHSSILNTQYLISWLFSSLILLFDIAIVSIIKICYVYYLLNSTSTLLVTMSIQICFSIIDLSWNRWVSFILLSSKWFEQYFYNKSHQYTLYLLLLLVNSIIGPSIATMVTDEKCFSEAFNGINPVKSEAIYRYCDFRLSSENRDCSLTDSLLIETEFIPPFIYSHECYTAVIKHFLPLVVLNQFMITFIRPVLWHFAAKQPQYSYYFGKYLACPAILWPHLDHQTSLFDPYKILTEMMHQLAIFLSYGLVSPIIAIIGTISISMSYNLWDVILKRYYSTRSSNAISSASSPLHSPHSHLTANSTTNAIAPASFSSFSDEEGSNGVKSEILAIPSQQVSIIITFSMFFLVCLSIDIAGDESEEAMINLILIVSLPCICWLYFFSQFVNYYYFSYLHSVDGRSSVWRERLISLIRRN